METVIPIAEAATFPATETPEYADTREPFGVGSSHDCGSALISTEGVEVQGTLVEQRDAGETTVTDVHVAEASPLPMKCLATNTTMSCGSAELPSEGGLGRQNVSAGQWS